MTRKERLWGFGWFAAIIAFLVLNFSIAFLLTSWLYARVGIVVAPLLAQGISSMLGLVLTFAGMGTVARLFRSRIRAGEMRLYGPIIDALERIAKGDFSVRVDNAFEENAQSRGRALGQLAKSVNNMALELKQMETMRQEFISNVSHEIQSPLTSIRGFAQALQNDRLSADERHHYLTIIETESARLSKLADDLLKLASLEADQVKFEPKAYRLDKQIRSLILLCEPQWTAKSLDMDVSLEEVTLCADEDLLSRVWLNLIHNSIKFTPERGRVCIDLRRRERCVEVKVADTGIGIAPEDQLHVFERFYKADKSRQRSTEGSGLGLSIAHKIVEMHRGTIALQSDLGAGTTFTVTLPAEQP